MKLVRVKLLLVGVLSFVFLLWLWPNLVHEPLHFVALRVQGVDAQIVFDWSHWPAHPSTVKLGQVAGIPGGLLYLLLPSLFSLGLLCGLWVSRVRASFLTHIVVPVYLVVDLVVNVMGYRSPTDDFHFLVVFPSAVPLLLSAVLLLGVAWLLRVVGQGVEVFA